MQTTSLALICTTAALLATSQATAQATMVPLPTFGTNGWLAPGTTPYLTTGNTERGMSFNPQTGNVIVVARQNVGGVSNNVHVIDGTTGADLFQLDNTGITGGTFAVNMVDVDVDGAIYVGNLSTSATSNFKVYKWDSEATGVSTPPTVVYDAVSGVTRTGDAFAVTGSSLLGTAQFAAAGSNNVNASNFVVGPLDGSNGSTAYLSVAGTTTTSNDYRLALTFVDQSTLIGNQGATAQLTTFDPVSGATLAASIPLGGAARRAMDYTVINGRPLLAVIDTNSSIVTVLDLSDPTAPAEIASATTTSGTLSGNTNGTGGVAWGAVSGSTATLYAMSSNQGIQAFLVDLSPLASATNFGTGCDGLVLNANSQPGLGNSGFELSVDNVPVVSPVALIGFGSASVNPGTNLAVIGMAGCFGYTQLDIGLYVTQPLVGTSGSYPLAIPNDPSLAGSTFTAQGLTFSAATALGLATSNGTEIVVGF